MCQNDPQPISLTLVRTIYCKRSPWKQLLQPLVLCQIYSIARVKKRVSERVPPRVMHRIRSKTLRKSLTESLAKNLVETLSETLGETLGQRVSDRILCMTLDETFSETRCVTRVTPFLNRLVINKSIRLCVILSYSIFGMIFQSYFRNSFLKRRGSIKWQFLIYMIRQIGCWY